MGQWPWLPKKLLISAAVEGVEGLGLIMGRLKATVFLGAGWSRVAGLPLARDLIGGPIAASSAEAEKRLLAVLQAYETWRSRNPTGNSELFLRHCYNHKPQSLIGEDRKTLDFVPWPWAAEFVQARLATPHAMDRRSSASLRYGQRIIHRTYCGTHTQFWLDTQHCYDLHAVITTNYDILVERSLRHREMRRPPLPGFHYGGLPAQAAKGQREPWTVLRPNDRVIPSGRVPLFKLHGSLSWSIERGDIAVYQDLRAAFRGGGTAAIVPPLLAKQTPEWLAPIWEGSADALAQSDVWVIVGYSLPDYDAAVRALLRDAADNARLREIRIHDPNAAALRGAWRGVAPDAEIAALPGLGS